MTMPVPAPSSAPRRLRRVAHAAVLGLALAMPFAGSPPEADPRSASRPASVLGSLRAGGLAAEDSSEQRVHVAPEQGPHRVASRRPRRQPVWSVARPARGPVSSRFGWRRHPVSGQVRHHDGADLAVPLGSTVHAVASGVVRSVGRRSGYGLVVEIEHRPAPERARFRTLYAHLSKADRRLRHGASIRRGQPVGASGGVPGRDGTSTGPHLHFEVRDASGRALDPAPFLGAASPRHKADEQRWQVMFSSGRNPPTARLDRRGDRRARAAFALPSPAGSRVRARPPR